MNFKQINVVDVRDMPMDVEAWCVEQEISTHYQDDVAMIENDGNPFAEWLNENGYKWKNDCNPNSEPECDYFAILATQVLL